MLPGLVVCLLLIVELSSSLLDWPLGSDPAFHVVWCRFRMMRRFLAYNSRVLEIARIYRLLGEVNKSCMKVVLE